MKCVILPHHKNYKLKKLFSVIEKNNDNIVKIDNILNVNDLDLPYYFLSSGMKNILSDNVSLQTFLFMEQSDNPVLILESPALRMLSNVRQNWIKLVWNSFFMDEGIHPYDPSFDRWEMLSKTYGISVHDYQRRGHAILFNLQREYDAALNRLTFNDIKYRDWCIEILQKIRSISDRPIIIRKHPLESSVENYLKENLKLDNIEFSQRENFYDDLNRCWCMINYNSTSSVESVIHGTHTICLDPSSFAWDVSGHSIEDIENDLSFDRYPWLKKIAYMQWHIDELQDSYVWDLVKSCIWK